MLPHTLLTPALTCIFAKMAAIHNCTISVWQRSFLTELFQTVFALRGRVNFTNLARYSRFGEQTFRRHFAKAFQWVVFNLVVVRMRRHPDEPLLGVFDCSFLPKSGTETYGIDRFFSSALGRAQRGLEVSILGMIATQSRRAFGLDATRTPAGLSTRESGPYSRVDFYLEQILDLAKRIWASDLRVTHWVGDGYYAKTKIMQGLRQAGYHLITRLRADANLRYRYTGRRKKGPGAPKRYDGKIDWRDQAALFRHFEEVDRLPDHPQVRVLTIVANSPPFGRDLRIVVLIAPDADRYVILGSTDIEQPAEEIVRYYRLRYQIEFVIRDAKQHTGLTHCQARSQEKIDFHLNMSVAAVGVLRLLAEIAGISPRSYCREAYNRMIVDRLFSQLGLSTEFDVSHPRVQPVLQTGRMAA